MIDPEDVRARLAAVIGAMKLAGAWDVARPDDDAFVDPGAFGGHTMAFEHWLRWVFVPNALAAIASGGPWPATSELATQAVREGDTNPTVAALVDALTAFDAAFCDDARRNNEAGWRLLTRPGHTREDLEAAVACFRRAVQLQPEVPQAAPNLGRVLVELDREADAISELDRVAVGEGALAAYAHNWLGWRITDRDRDRALVHLRAATRLRPAWGVTWQNLARALDAAGEIAAACQAYSEAIVCGDAHDDAFARDRRLQLEMQLLWRREPVPPVPDTVRADSLAFAIVCAAAARLPEPRAFMVRPTTREVRQAMIGTVIDNRAYCHAFVDAGREWAHTATLARDGDVVVFDSRRGSPAEAADAAGAAGALLAWLAAFDPAELTPLDALIYLRDAVLAKRPSGWWWSLDSTRPAGLRICDEPQEMRLVIRARPGGGLELTLPPTEVRGVAATLVAETPARLIELTPAIDDTLARAFAARSALTSRPFGIRTVSARLAAALDLGAPRVYWRYPDWPYGHFHDARGSVSLLDVADTVTGCAIQVGRQRFEVSSADQLTALMPAIAAAVAVEPARVTADRIKPGERFRVVAELAAFSPGSEIVLADVSTLSREGERAFRFASAAGGACATLTEIDDLAVLSDLDRYLERL